MPLLLADKIRARREELGLSKASLGRAVGVTGQAVSLWEAGARQVSLEVLAQLASALHVEPHDLLSKSQITQIDPAILAKSLASFEAVEALTELTIGQKAKVIAFIYSKGGVVSSSDALALCRLAM